WGRVPSVATRTALPRGLGPMALAPPFAGGHPAIVWNNVGRIGILGASTLQSRPAPSVLFRSAGLPAPVVVTLQGLIEDAARRSATGWTVTNAIVLRIG